MKPEEIKEFWESRAKKYGTSPQSTTHDYFMRQLEIRFMRDSIKHFSETKRIHKIADIGCGNGYSTVEFAKYFQKIEFTGYDYSEEMINCAKKYLADNNPTNLKFCIRNVATEQLDSNFDLIYSDRCLINLSTWELQKSAIKNIHNFLSKGGIYIMVENFIDGQNNFNKLRRNFGLKKIEMHDYSLYFDRDILEEFISDIFEILEFKNISSMYYVVSRIIYTKLCVIANKEPDYFDKHHELASLLPYAGNYGPTAMYYLRKR